MTSCSRVDGVQQHACMASSGGARCCKQRRDGQGPVPVARTPLKTHLRSRVYSLVICTSGAQSNKDEIGSIWNSLSVPSALLTRTTSMHARHVEHFVDGRTVREPFTPERSGRLGESVNDDETNEGNT